LDLFMLHVTGHVTCNVLLNRAAEHAEQ
jgi:hypothetical protein